MRQSAVEVEVGGKTYRVVASAQPEVVQRLAGMVDERLRSLVAPRRVVQPQSLLLAALALANDLEEERAQRLALEARSRDLLTSVLHRIDAALADESGSASPEDPDPQSPSAP